MQSLTEQYVFEGQPCEQGMYWHVAGGEVTSHWNGVRQSSLVSHAAP
jgi:hypothetical protein